jgi:non-specific serine/threonine protein kinase
MPLTPASRLGPYEIVALLGAGGMGEVYRARDARLKRDIAIKVLPDAVASSPERLARFEREATTVAGLNHPNIVVLHSIEEAQGTRFLTMELVEGSSLEQSVTPGGLPIARVIELGIALADALAAAHEKGVIHRDLKPANVMLTKDGRVKVLDFGLAKLAAPDSDPDSTHEATRTTLTSAAGHVVGTVPYMAPEQVRGEAVDARTDLFALGVLLYELASGTRPFAGATPADISSAILRDAPESLDALRSDLPRDLGRIVSRCLEKNPRERVQSALDVSNELHRLRRDLERGRISGSSRIEDRPTGNLPLSLDSFVAREQELASVVALLAEARLVTLTGVGGTGKTRLALEAAHRLSADFPDGAWLVELAPVTHAEAVPNVVGDLLGVRQGPGKALVQSIADALRHRAMLLVLDNCEHVLDTVAELATLIARQCADVRILATSREALGIGGERILRLQSLSDPEGARLFRDRALAAGAIGILEMEALERLSHRLDGMPLAIELAAARCGTMTPEDIERRLDHRFQLLRGTRRGRIERHQTLHQTVAWSYELLEPQEQRVFDRLSVFAGGFTLDAARAVAGGEDLDALEVEEAIAALVARSMTLAQNTEDSVRYRLLETLRQFGEERLLASGDAPEVRRRHVRYFADFMTRAWSGLWSTDASAWIRAVDREFENLRVAVYAAIDLRDREALGALLKPHYFWAWHSLRYEVGDWAEAALEVSPEPAFARALAVHLRVHGGRPEEGVRLAAKLDDPEKAGDPDAVCLTTLSHLMAAMPAGGPAISEWMRRAAVAGERTGNAALATLLKSMQAVPKTMAGEMDEARRIAVEAYDQAKAIGNPIALCEASFHMGRTHADSDPEVALEYFDRATELAEKHRLPFFARSAETEAAAATARIGDASSGGMRLSLALRAFIHSGDRGQLWTSAHHLLYFLVRIQRSEDALRIWRELGSRRSWVSQPLRDELTRLLGPPGEAVLSDDELIERIVGVLDTLDREARDPGASSG